MYCTTCHYCLDHLQNNACPECGQAFDPNDKITFLQKEPKYSPLAVKKIKRIIARSSYTSLSSIVSFLTFVYLQSIYNLITNEKIVITCFIGLLAISLSSYLVGLTTSLIAIKAKIKISRPAKFCYLYASIILFMLTGFIILINILF